MRQEMIAPCGMNCCLCISYQSMIHDLNKKGFNKKYCPGCVPRGENCTHMGNACSILKEGQVRFCYECKVFPCRRLQNLDKRYNTKYGMSMIKNLEFIRDGGVSAFLNSELRKWECDVCKDIICCHNGLCLNCEMNKLLESRKNKK